MKSTSNINSNIFYYTNIYEKIHQGNGFYHGQGKHFHSSLNARVGITLENCKSDDDINSAMGTISVIDCPFLKDLNARNGIQITNSTVRHVKCFMGNVIALNCQVGEIYAQDGMTIHNFTAEKLTVSMGKIEAHNSMLDSIVSSIEARDGISMTNVKAHDVKVTMGEVVANSCTANRISAQSSVSLTESTVNTVILNVENTQATLVLNNSSVEGNVVVKASVNTPHVELVIQGKGVIKGKVIFEGCEGTIQSGDGIVIQA
ncbi:MAG: hypothetical protein K940chlam3_01128 [Chlamydiae bacterium]|nr:hypothetical protein [Chlamydiota bacterium]